MRVGVVVGTGVDVVSMGVDVVIGTGVDDSAGEQPYIDALTPFANSEIETVKSLSTSDAGQSASGL